MNSMLFPFWWLNPVTTCANVKACLEGDFSSYTLKWRCDTGFTATLSHSMRPRNDGSCFFWDYTNDDVYEIDSEGTLGDPKDTDIQPLYTGEYSYPTAAFWRSIMDKYLAMVDVAKDCLIVYKEGVLVHDRDVDLDKGAFTFDATAPIVNIGISFNGKYVAVMCEKDADGHGVILMYEGS